MNKFDFQKYWRKYGNFILMGLFFLFIINYCSRQPVAPSQQDVQQQEQPSENVNQNQDEPHLKSYEQLMMERQPQQQEGPGGFFTVFLLMLSGVGIVWLARQPWWIRLWEKWFPGRVRFRAFKAKDHVTGRNLLKISIVNNTGDGLTFMPPMLVFRSWGKERRFRFRPSEQDEMFPITLTPGTGHRVVLDVDQFYEKIPDLKSATRVGASVETTGGSQYKSFALPRWLDLLVK
jgi:hypothetical protein